MPPLSAAATPDVSIVIATKDRAASLDRTLRSVMDLSAGPVRFEVLVIDNGSADGTGDVIAEWARRSGGSVRTRRELRPGVSYARNTGIDEARAPVIAFLDDDEEPAGDWLAVVNDTLHMCPDIDAVGGPVRAVWESPPPAWLQGRELGGHVGVIDGGPEPFRVTRRRWFCLGAGNLAMRREMLQRLGGFDPAYRRSQDRELLVRLLLQGGAALYQPAMIVSHHVEGARLTRAYFQNWAAMEGRMRAGYVFEELFLAGPEMCPLPVTVPRVLGVPTGIHKSLIVAAAKTLAAALGRSPDAFRHEVRVRYLWNYVKARAEMQECVSRSQLVRLFARDVGALAAGKLHQVSRGGSNASAIAPAPGLGIGNSPDGDARRSVTCPFCGSSHVSRVLAAGPPHRGACRICQSRFTLSAVASTGEESPQRS